MIQNKFLRKTIFGIGILIVYAGLALLITWPLAANLSTTLPGASGDTLLHYWNGWATKQAMIAGQSPFFTKLIFYPGGVSLITHNMAWFQILPWLLLERFIDGITAYNLTLLFSLTLCGGAAFLLVYKLTKDIKASFLAGLIYMAWPFRLSQLDHPNLLATQWIPIFMFFLLNTLERGRWRDVLLTAVSLALIGYGRWQLLIPATIMALIMVLFQWRKWWPKSERSRLIRLGVSAVLATILLLPPAYFLLQEQQNDPDAADIFRGGEETIMQSDLLAYMTPSNLHFLLRDITAPIYDKYYAVRFPSRRYAPYIGLTTLLLAILAMIKRRRESFPWLIMGLVMILLAMGPLLRVNGVEYAKFPMLYRILEPLQIIRLMREPDRFNMFLALPAAVLGGYGTSVILSRLRVKWIAVGVTIGLAVLVLVEYLVIPVPLLKTPEPSPFFQSLATESGSFAVLNLPFDSLKAKDYMFEQVTHQRPLVQGNLSRIPPGAYKTIERNPWLSTLMHTVEMDPAYLDVGGQLAQLAADDIRYLIMHKDLVGIDRIQHWQRYLLTEPYYEDNKIIVYRTEPQINQDFSLQDELIPGLGVIRTIINSGCMLTGQTLEVDVGWGSSKAIFEDYAAELSLIDSKGVVQLKQAFPVSDGFPSSQWPVQALFWGYYKLQIPEDFPPGSYDLVLNLQEAEAGTLLGEPQKVGGIVIQRDVCQIDPIDDALTVNAMFGDRLHLLAYEIEQDNHLDLRLHWQANQRMDNDFKIFVHVFDLTTAVPVAQYDAMPHKNAYPTRFWGLEEIVEDQIRISLADVPAGSYGLAVGVYDPITGQRLEAVDSEGKIMPDGRLILPETVDIQ